MIFHERNSIEFLEFPHLRQFRELRHAIFTRKGGVSRPPFKSLNTGVGVGDSRHHVIRNRKRIARIMAGDELVFTHQVHGRTVAIVAPDASGGANHRKADALITEIPGKDLVIQVADCQPVMLYASDRHVAANVHSGWRGSIANIIGRTVALMVSAFGCDPGRIHAAIGPSLGPCCAEFVNYRREIPANLWRYRDDRHRFDFWQMSRDQLKDAGVPDGQIGCSELCTRCRTDLFFSYRGEKTTGRFAAVIGVR